MTSEIATAQQPYVRVPGNGFWNETELFLNLRREHYALHPDHEKTPFPQSCPACAAIVAYQDAQVRVVGVEFVKVYVCSECGAEVANEDLLAEHQVTVHEMTAQTEADRLDKTGDGPLEDQLDPGGRLYGT